MGRGFSISDSVFHTYVNFYCVFVPGPYPIVTPENATVSVSENGLFDQTLVDFAAAAYTDFNRTQRAILKVEIIQGMFNPTSRTYSIDGKLL